MPEGLKGEPEEDDGVEEAVQTMGPEDLQKWRRTEGRRPEEERDGGCEREGFPRTGARGRDRKRQKQESMRKGCG